jgi:hypothetical protein
MVHRLDAKLAQARRMAPHKSAWRLESREPAVPGESALGCTFVETYSVLLAQQIPLIWQGLGDF